MTTAPDYTRATGLLYTLSSAGDSGLGSAWWAGYVAGADLGAGATLDAVWQDRGGTYVFAAPTPPDLAAFLAELGGLIRSLPGARLLWIGNATAADSSDWTVQVAQAKPSGSGTGITWSLSRAAEFDLGEYAVRIEQGTALTQADPATLGYGIAIAAAGFGFAAPHGGAAASAGSSWLPLAGQAVGSWRADLAFPDDAMAQLGVTLRYGAPATDGAPGDHVEILDAAVLGTAAGAVTLHLAYDPLNPLLAARTALRFFDDSGSGSPQAMSAAFRTSLGYPTNLTPKAPGGNLPGGALAFGFTPLQVPDDPASASLTYHLAPAGAYSLSVSLPAGVTNGATDYDLILGLSGLEYAELPSATGPVACFAPGGAAYAPFAGPDVKPPAQPEDPLTSSATTAYMTVLPAASGAASLTYYAQPAQAPLYAGGTTIGPGFLDFHQVPAAALPAWPTSPASPLPTFPALPYAGCASPDSELARRIEHAALAPARRASITTPAGKTGNETITVTPQGLMLDVSDAGIEKLVIANMPSTDERQLALGVPPSAATLGPDLQAALQSNQLFFVVADPAKLNAQASVPFRLDTKGLHAAAAMGVPSTVVTAVGAITNPSSGPVLYANEQAFRNAIQTAAGTWIDPFVDVGGFLKAVMSDWTFQISPSSWRAPEAITPRSATVMIAKYASRPLEALVDDVAAWPWQDAAALPGHDVTATREMIARIFAHARDRWRDTSVPRDDPYVVFYTDVVADREWNGILVLNAPVAIDELPRELQFLSAGIDHDRFYAHHLGFSATPLHVTNGDLALSQTAAFGLIDYQDPEDLVLEKTVPFAFKTLSLTARFTNAALSGFNARCELMTNELFGVELTKVDPTHGNNLVLTGSYQQQDGKPAYAFALEGRNLYLTRRSALESVEVAAVRLNTVATTGPTDPLVTSFVLTGELRFADLPGFDLFSYGTFAPEGGELDDGHLRYDRMVVTMTAPPAAEPTFALALDGVRFDLTNSAPRKHSLVRNFPVTLTGLVAASGQKPDDLDFASISAPIDQAVLEPPWYGLEYTLDLGTLGALSGGKSLTLGVLAAWGPGTEEGDRPVYLGLRLPGGRSSGTQWPLQGVLKLGFRSFQFLAADEGDRRSYILRLRRFALSILGLSFPPGNTDVLLVGDPNAPAGAETKVVAWYAAYGGL